MEAALTYVARREGFQFTHILDESQSNLDLRPEKVLVRNVRSVSRAPSLATEGFAVVRRPTLFTEFLDVPQLITRYAAEVIDAVREISGAAEVVGFPPAVRITDPGERKRQLNIPGAARHLHLDFSGASLRDHLHRYAGVSPAQIAGCSRVCVYNTWRSITPPPQDTPLALCDVRSVRPEDVSIVNGFYPLGDVGYFEIQVLDYSPEHRWWFFPDLSTDELLIFLGGELDRPTAGVFHGAFDNPACPERAAPRWSVEMRTVALFR